MMPDFMIKKPNGFADIIEFKLSDLKDTIDVGKIKKESFSAEINAYTTQTRK